MVDWTYLCDGFESAIKSIELGTIFVFSDSPITCQSIIFHSLLLKAIMPVQSSGPSTGEGATSANDLYPQLRCRHYGPFGIQDFEILRWPHASVGDASIGKVEVDCRFLFEKSVWGVLDSVRSPAGIIYMDLGFRQPAGHRLKSATVTVTLKDADESDINASRRAPSRPGPKSHSLSFGRRAPEVLRGEDLRAEKTKRLCLKPEVNIPAVCSFGGVGFESETKYPKEYHWTLSSNLRRNPRSTRGASVYRVLTWELTENELAAQYLSDRTINTAFSLHHDREPFFMDVNIQGRLQQRVSDTTHVCKKKFASSSSDQPCATTLINFGNEYKFSKPLDELQEGLNAEMLRANLRSCPIEIPNSRDGMFQEAPARGEAATQHPATMADRYQRSERNTTASRTAGTQNVTTSGGTEVRSCVDDDPCLPTVENLADVSQHLLDLHIARRYNMRARSYIGGRRARLLRRNRDMRVTSNPRIRLSEASVATSATLVNEEPERAMSGQANKQANEDVNMDSSRLIIIQIALIRHFLRILANFLVNPWSTGRSRQQSMPGSERAAQAEMDTNATNFWRDRS